MFSSYSTSQECTRIQNIFDSHKVELSNLKILAVTHSRLQGGPPKSAKLIRLKALAYWNNSEKLFYLTLRELCYPEIASRDLILFAGSQKFHLQCLQIMDYWNVYIYYDL